MDAVFVILGCCVWIPLCVWIWSLVGWMITQEIELIPGIVGIWVAITLGYVCLKPPAEAPIASPLAFLAVLATLVMYPFARSALDRRALKSLDVEGLERAYDALSLKPMNPVAKFKVAKHTYDVGMPGHALAIAEAALVSLPEQHFREEHRIVRAWRGSVTKPDFFKAIACTQCGQMNQPGNIHCAACGSPFLLERARGRVLGKGQGKKLVAAWIAMVAMLGVIPASTALPPLLSILVIVVAIGASGAIVFMAFHHDEAVT